MLSDAKRSVFWSGIQQVSVFGIQFVISLVVARLITPEDYGIVALTIIFFSIAQIILGFGMEGALIQKKECTRKDYSTAFIVASTGGVVFYITFYATSGLIASFFNMPDLEKVIKISALILIFRAISIVPYAKLQRELKFRNLAKISASVTIVSGIIAIVMAYRGYAYWALVVQSLLSSVCMMFLYFISSGWRLSVRFSTDSFRQLMGFGFPMMLSSLIKAVYDNLYSFVIGKRFNERQLGLFNRGCAFSGFIPTNLSDFTMRALFPIFSRYQDNLPLLREQAKRTLHLTAFVAFPLNFFLIFNGKDLTMATLGSEWMGIVPIVRIMGLAYLTYTVCNVQLNLLKTVSRTDRLFICEAVKITMGIAILVISLNRGFMALVAGLLIYSILNMVIGALFVYPVTGLGLMDYVKSLLGVTLIAIASVCAGFCAASPIENIYARLCVSGIMSSALFIGLSYLFRDKAIQFFLGYLKRK